MGLPSWSKCRTSTGPRRLRRIPESCPPMSSTARTDSLTQSVGSNHRTGGSSDHLRIESVSIRVHACQSGGSSARRSRKVLKSQRRFDVGVRNYGSFSLAEETTTAILSSCRSLAFTQWLRQKGPTLRQLSAR